MAYDDEGGGKMTSRKTCENDCAFVLADGRFRPWGISGGWSMTFPEMPTVGTFHLLTQTHAKFRTASCLSSYHHVVSLACLALPGAYCHCNPSAFCSFLAGCVLRVLLPAVLSFFLLILADGFFLVYVLTASL